MHKMIELIKYRISRMKLKTIYNFMFRVLVVTPILGVLVVVLLILNQEFKQQSIANIEQMQQTIISELTSDINTMSMRLASLVYANDSEILKKAMLANTSDTSQGYLYASELSTVAQLFIEPEKNMISVYFYMKEGNDVYMKSYVSTQKNEVQNQVWYQNALNNKDRVMVGTYTTVGINDLYQGGSDHAFILIFAISPQISRYDDVPIEVVQLYCNSTITERIKHNNSNYLNGKNKLGISEIRDEEGNTVYATYDASDLKKKHNMVTISSPVEIAGSTWYVENYIEASELTETYWASAFWVLLVACAVLLLVGYYSRFFLRSIIIPIEKVHRGLAQVEEGNLDVHIKPEGQFEIRNMIHQYNGMVRHLKALKKEYEETLNNRERGISEYFKEIMSTSIIPDNIEKEYNKRWKSSYVLILIMISHDDKKANVTLKNEEIIKKFQHHTRYVSRCCEYVENANTIYVYYRVNEVDYQYNIEQMLKDIQTNVKKECDVNLFACIGVKQDSIKTLIASKMKIEEYSKIRYLVDKTRIVNLEGSDIDFANVMGELEEKKKFANALFTADEKNLIVYREQLFESIHELSLKEVKEKFYAIIIAISLRFEEGNDSLEHIFGQNYDYIAKLERIDDMKSLRLWLMNFLNWILEYSASNTEKGEVEMIVKAKRYMIDHYEEIDLSLSDVANHVGLHEKYFTNRFTKEAGETVTDFLTQLRIQKAKELLKNTTFKVYEVAEMVGYKNVEHFNRVFKKEVGMSPTKYRK